MTDTTDLPARLRAVLTERFTALGNPFSEMRTQEKGPDGWPASHPVGPDKVAEVLRELLADDPARQVLGTTTGQPATAPAVDRATVLREAADRYTTLADQNEAYDREHGDLDEVARAQHGAVRDVAAGLRRMADEQWAADWLRRLADEQPEPETADTIGLCGACGVPRESHHHGYVRTPHFDDEAQQPTPAPAEETKP